MSAPSFPRDWLPGWWDTRSFLRSIATASKINGAALGGFTVYYSVPVPESAILWAGAAVFVAFGVELSSYVRCVEQRDDREELAELAAAVERTARTIDMETDIHTYIPEEDAKKVRQRLEERGAIG